MRRAETDRLEQLARDLLFLAKRDDGTATQLEVTTLAPMVEEAVDAAQARAGERQVRIELHVDPTATARVSGALLRPAVDNLLTNALRFSPSGSTVMVRLHRDEAVTAIDVLDEGPGFPPEFLPHAFDRFSRGDPARSRDGGAGLGLSIVRAVAEAHGGSVEAVNRAGWRRDRHDPDPDNSVSAHRIVTRSLQSRRRMLTASLEIGLGVPER